MAHDSPLPGLSSDHGHDRPATWCKILLESGHELFSASPLPWEPRIIKSATLFWLLDAQPPAHVQASPVKLHRPASKAALKERFQRMVGAETFIPDSKLKSVRTIGSGSFATGVCLLVVLSVICP